jgi:hypothetical protein
MDLQGVREACFIQSQNICKHLRYIGRNTDNNNAVCLTMTQKIIFNNFNSDICNNVLGEKYT